MTTLYRGIAAVLPDGAVKRADIAFDGATGKFTYAAASGGNAPECDTVIDGAGLLMLPGLINAHTHLSMVAMRGYGDDRTLQDWLFNYIFPVEARLDRETIRATAALAIAESLACGVTSVTDMYLLENAVAEVCVETGIKANLAKSYESDDVLPDGTIAKTSLADFADMWNYAGDGRVKVDAMIHAEYTTEPETWEKVARLCSDRNLIVHTHISETELEHNEAKSRRNGLSPARAMAERGVFQNRVSAAHCVWLDDEDVELFARSGASVLHCPVSNLKLGSGVAPIGKYLGAGINVAIGTDGASSNNSLDMLAETKLAAILQKGVTRVPTAIPAPAALRMATLGGAYAQGRESDSGAIKTGFDADFALLDLRSPRLYPCYDPILTAVYAATPADVVRTVVRGKTLYDHGGFPTIDMERVRASIGRHAVPTLFPDGQVETYGE